MRMLRLGFVVLFLAAAAVVVLVGPSRGGGGDEEGVHFLRGWMRPFSSSSSSPPPKVVLDGDLADRVWSLCLQDVVGAEEILGIGQSSSLDGLSGRSAENELKTVLLMELLALLPPEKSSFTQDCIRAHYLSLGIAQDFSVRLSNYEKFKKLSNYVENQQSLLGSNLYPRRNLAGRRIIDAPSISPVFAPAMSSGGEAQLPLAVAEPPVISPKSPNTTPPNQHLHNKAGQKHRAVPPAVSSSDKQHNYLRLVLTVVVPTAAFSFIAAFLIFYCCGCNKSKVSVGEPRDDHPLLHMQLANTPGSSPNIHVPVRLISSGRTPTGRSVPLTAS